METIQTNTNTNANANTRRLLDTSKHNSVFSTVLWQTNRFSIDVLGCGAVGSKLALGLGKLGIGNISLYDDDTVEAHNIANQAFDMSQIGLAKTIATKNLIRKFSGNSAKSCITKVTADKTTYSPGNIVFLCVDSMSARKEILTTHLSMNRRVELVVDVRMGKDNGRVYAFLPTNSRHLEAYFATLCNDDDVIEENACGFVSSVGATSDLVSAYALWSFLSWFKRRSGAELIGYADCIVANEMIFFVDPTHMMMTRNF